MPRFFLALALLAFPQPPKEDKPLAGARPPEAGDTLGFALSRTVTTETTITYKSKPDKPVVHRSETVDTARGACEVQQVADGRILSLIVDFKFAETRVTDQGASTTRKQALHDRAILVKRAGDDLAFEGADGVPASELWQVTIDPPFAVALPSPLPEGKKWKPDEAALRRYLARLQPEIQVESVEAEYKLERTEKKKDLMVGTVKIQVKSKGRDAQQLASEIRFHGTVLVDVNWGRYVGMDVKAEYSLEGEPPVPAKHEPVTIKGSGKIALKQSLDWDFPKK